MIKNYFTLIALLCSFSLFAQDVPEVQQSMISKVTATWCTACGSWGWNLFAGVVEDNNDNALVVATHYSGDLMNSTASAITNNFNVNSQPRFVVNDVDQGASSGNASTKRTDIANMVATNAAMPPVVNAGLTVVLTDDNELEIKTNTMFFQNADGEYNLAAYIVEDNVIANQASQGANANHKNILRAGASTDAFGELIVNGTVSAGETFQKNFVMPIDASWDKSI